MSKALIGIVLLFTLSTQAYFGRYLIPNPKEIVTTHSVQEVDSELNPEEINVLVWNIYKGSKKTFPFEFADLAKNKDIILVQEGLVDQKFEEQVSVYDNLEFHFATSWMDAKKNNLRTGVYNASIAKAIRVRWLRSFFREPVTNTPKMQLFTEYKIAGTRDTLLVGNIHAINFVSVDKFMHMLNQAAIQIRMHSGPVVFGGDFNTHLISRYNFMTDLAAELGLQMVQFSVDHRKKFFGRYFDFVFTKGLEVKEAVAPHMSGSDHNPMMLKLSLL